MKIFIKVCTVVTMLFVMACCTPVKEYQKMFVNDRDMELNNKSIEKYEGNMEVFREGAAGANGGKSGGGCACN